MKLLFKLLPLFSAITVSVLAKPIDTNNNGVAERQVIRRHIFCEGIHVGDGCIEPPLVNGACNVIKDYAPGYKGTTVFYNPAGDDCKLCTGLACELNLGGAAQCLGVHGDTSLGAPWARNINSVICKWKEGSKRDVVEDAAPRIEAVNEIVAAAAPVTAVEAMPPNVHDHRLCDGQYEFQKTPCIVLTAPNKQCADITILAGDWPFDGGDYWTNPQGDHCKLCTSRTCEGECMDVYTDSFLPAPFENNVKSYWCEWDDGRPKRAANKRTPDLASAPEVKSRHFLADMRHNSYDLDLTNGKCKSFSNGPYTSFTNLQKDECFLCANDSCNGENGQCQRVFDNVVFSDPAGLDIKSVKCKW